MAGRWPDKPRCGFILTNGLACVGPTGHLNKHRASLSNRRYKPERVLPPRCGKPVRARHDDTVYECAAPAGHNGYCRRPVHEPVPYERKGKRLSPRELARLRAAVGYYPGIL